MQDFFDGQMEAGHPRSDLSAILRDFEYFSGICPRGLRELRSRVKAVCDRLDYQGSPIYDEYPDRIMIERICQKITEEMAEAMNESEDSREDKTQIDKKQIEKNHSIVPFPEDRQRLEKKRNSEKVQDTWGIEEDTVKTASAGKDNRVEAFELNSPGCMPSYGREERNSYSGTVILGNPRSDRSVREDRYFTRNFSEPELYITEAEGSRGRNSAVTDGRIQAEHVASGRPPVVPWGPPSDCLWGPPPLPNCPCGSSSCCPGGSGSVDLGDTIMLLFLGEIQHRRCIHRNCR